MGFMGSYNTTTNTSSSHNNWTEGESWVQDPLGVCNLPIKRKKLLDFLSFNNCVTQNLRFNEQTELTICIPDNIFQQTHDNYHIPPNQPDFRKDKETMARTEDEQTRTINPSINNVKSINTNYKNKKKILAFL